MQHAFTSGFAASSIAPRKSYHRNAEATVAMTDASPSARRAPPRDPGRGRAVRAPARGGPERVADWRTGRVPPAR
jgi:hypothetical protein